MNDACNPSLQKGSNDERKYLPEFRKKTVLKLV